MAREGGLTNLYQREDSRVYKSHIGENILSSRNILLYQVIDT